MHWDGSFQVAQMTSIAKTSRRTSALALLALLACSAAIPAAEGFFFGPFPLRGFFQPSPLNVPTFSGRTQVGGIYINAFPFTTPPAGHSMH